jgi:hypothetical protein
MMGDAAITTETKERISQLCAEAGVMDMSDTCATEAEAERFMDELQKRMKERAPDTI